MTAIRHLLFLSLLCTGLRSAAQKMVTPFVGDTVKTTLGYGQFNMRQPGAFRGSVGIGSGLVVVLAEHQNKGRRSFLLRFPSEYTVVAQGTGVDRKGKGLQWKDRMPQSGDTPGTYRFLLATAGDSAANFTLISGYVFLPDRQRWKFIGTVRRPQWGYLPDLSLYTPDNDQQAWFEQVTVQRANGSYKTVSGYGGAPAITPLRDLDSSARAATERSTILAYTLADSVQWKEKQGVFYRILAPGAGRQVAVTDTVEVHYKGYLFPNGEVFDQTREKTARFPLNRLVTGWQIAVPELKEGGKMIGIIPSALAYSIRTRSPKIPPNSILVFEVEVVKATSAR